ncbi:MAG: hypothetical protein K2P44_09800 [Lachnospiraceae bacterium]|nr:hypothetical protein [Lachnospiraceae bacterium]
MTKNIIVVDAHGKKYGTTYLKRAKGLVKQGRARFLAQNMLCLACPPEQNLEDNDMSDQTMENRISEHEEFQNISTETVGACTAADDAPTSDKYSMEYCLEQIERIGRQTEYLDHVLSELRQMDNDSLANQKATALSDVVKCRETTNQQMLAFYGKMYDDLKKPAVTDAVSQKARLQEQLMAIMDKAIENGDFSTSEIGDMFNGAFDSIRHIND